MENAPNRREQNKQKRWNSSTQRIRRSAWREKVPSNCAVRPRASTKCRRYVLVFFFTLIPCTILVNLCKKFRELELGVLTCFFVFLVGRWIKGKSKTDWLFFNKGVSFVYICLSWTVLAFHLFGLIFDFICYITNECMVMTIKLSSDTLLKHNILNSITPKSK